MSMSKYIRKYYLHRRVKECGCCLDLRKVTKTILLFRGVEVNKYIQELKEKYSYGVQYINPLFYDKSNKSR